jgi:hypothetical protein
MRRQWILRGVEDATVEAIKGRKVAAVAMYLEKMGECGGGCRGEGSTRRRRPSSGGRLRWRRTSRRWVYAATEDLEEMGVCGGGGR